MTVHQEENNDVIGNATITGGGLPNHRAPQAFKRRLLFLSLEFNYSPFSGNGVLARSLASSLAQRDDCAAVRVVCARPHPASGGASDDIRMACRDDDDGRLEIWPVDLPPRCQWRRLDRGGAWREYAAAFRAGDDSGVARRAREFRPTDVVAVDWHGMLAWDELRRWLSPDNGDDALDVSVCYYNFRVYSSSSWCHSVVGRSDGAEDEETDDLFYKRMERISCRVADRIVCLAEHDRRAIRRLMEEDGDCDRSHHLCLVEKKAKNICVLHPPLRGDVRDLATTIDKNLMRHDRHLPFEARSAIESAPFKSLKRRRLFITCMVRLSPEKSPHLFVSILQRLGGVDFLRKNFLIPVMCGARSVDDYAVRVVDDFHSLMRPSSFSKGCEGAAWPCVIIERHLGPEELSALFSCTAINVHPCLYDAYGMTLVEAAAFGAPSIVNRGGKIGAASLLGEGEGCIPVDMEKMSLESGDCGDDFDEVQKLIESSIENMQEKAGSPENDSSSLGHIAQKGRTQALGWDETACCQGLIDILNGID